VESLDVNQATHSHSTKTPYLLTPLSRVFLEKLTVNFAASQETKTPTNVFLSELIFRKLYFSYLLHGAESLRN
jgi:hypothetical protein